MYSGTTFHNKSGRLVGVHQRIDRIAHYHLRSVIPHNLGFPTVKQVLHFEGLNGPDGIKRKSPAKDEPWHYIDPSNTSDTALLDMIDDHMYNLTAALKQRNRERAAFEAAWMSHAIVDGLTPAHHYPLSEKIEELWGKPKEERVTVRDKNIIRGKTRRETISKNWQYWGARGIYTSHFMFEWGVASTMATMRPDDFVVPKSSFERVLSVSYREYYYEIVQSVASMSMYEEFCGQGWTRKLAYETKDVLIPDIITAVVLAWYKACVGSGLKI